MKLVNELNEKSINTIVILIKLAMVFFTEITIYEKLSHRWEGQFNGNFTNVNLVLLMLFFAFSIYVAWVLLSKIYVHRITKSKIAPWIELLITISLLSFTMYLCNSYEAEIKYIFLLFIITTVMEYGISYGMVSTITSVIIVLVFDFYNAPTVNGVNKTFEGDLFIAAVYIFITSILGYYVNIEKEYKLRVTEKLNMLSNELKERDKSREKIEKVLMKNDVCFDMLFKNAQNAIIVHRNGKIFYANESAAKLLGYDNPETLNEVLIFKHYPEKIRKAAEKKYINICKNQLSNVVEEEKIIDSCGNSIEVRNNSSFLTYEGKEAVLTFLLDIRPEKQIVALKKDMEESERLLNETKEYNTMVTEFFTNMSHELKTPINVIYVAVQTMGVYLNKGDEGSLNRCKSYLKMMKQNCYRLIKLVNNLLDVTKIDSGFSRANKHNGNIVGRIEDIALSVAKYIETMNIELIFDTNVEEKIMAFDDNKMERIILNLLSNAIKYSHPGGKIMVSFEDRGSSVVISVKDEGDGIPADKIDCIFERFGQANRSLSRENEGTGIGLYLVKTLVEMHGGTIKVNSTEGKGSEFIIELPAEIIDEEVHEEEKFYEYKVERINIEFSDIYSISD